MMSLHWSKYFLVHALFLGLTLINKAHFYYSFSICDKLCNFAPLMFSKTKVCLHVMKVDTSGSDTQIARGLNPLHSRVEKFQLKVPDNKVGHSYMNLELHPVGCVSILVNSVL